MPVRILNTLADLARYSATDVCVVKNAYSADQCDDLIAATIAWRAERSPNEGRGKNWWYRITRDGSSFDSFLFRALQELEPATFRTPLVEAYRTLCDAHRYCGTVPPEARFEELATDRGALPSLDPLMFFYPPGEGRFRRHGHVSEWQKTQVLLNITRRGRDYQGGETLIEAEDGEIIELGECFDQGDIFSFPYRLFHSVNTVEAATPESRGRISVLIPFHRYDDSAIRY